MRLFAYKMTHDTGFAPNPFWGWMTLATCKSQIRRNTASTRAIGLPGSLREHSATIPSEANGSCS